MKLLTAAPCLPVESNLVLFLQKDNSTGGTSQSAFGDNFWFQEMLKLAYPKTKVKGFYVANDGTLPPGVIINEFNANQMLILREKSGFFEIVREVPDNLKLLPASERRLLSEIRRGCEISQDAKNKYFNSP
jgi:hypothetical protein